jgi:hypothetical protein
MTFATAFLVPQPERMFEPVDAAVFQTALHGARSAVFDLRADRLADELAAYRARCDAALAALPARTQEPPKC